MGAVRQRNLVIGLFAFVVLIGFTGWSVNATSSQPQILFINPATPEDQHWTIVTSMMRAAAEDLGVSLSVEYAFHSGEYTLRHVSLAAQAEEKPDYIVFRTVEEIGPEVLAKAHAAGIKTISIDVPFSKTEREKVGQPRDPYTSWLGQIVPDAIAASQRLGELIAQEAARKTRNSVVQFMAITGPEADIGSQMRLFGLKKGISAHGNSKLLGSFSGQWDTRTADREAYKAFRYAMEAPAWWAADDNMTIGVLNVLRNTHRKIGRDTFLGAFHWTEQVMTEIVRNRVHYVAGGHFIQGALALILAHDHFKGRDFIDLGVNHSLELGILYKGNLKTIGRIMISDAWDRIDFRRFSRVTNPALAAYDFRVNSYLEAVLGR